MGFIGTNTNGLRGDRTQGCYAEECCDEVFHDTAVSSIGYSGIDSAAREKVNRASWQWAVRSWQWAVGMNVTSKNVRLVIHSPRDPNYGQIRPNGATGSVA